MLWDSNNPHEKEKEKRMKTMTASDYRRAAELREQIENSERELNTLLGEEGATAQPVARKGNGGRIDQPPGGKSPKEGTMKALILKMTARKPMTLNQIVDELHRQGFPFRATRPQNSVGAFLYASGNKKLFRREGSGEGTKFSPR